MLKLLTWVKNTPVYVWIVSLLVLAFGVWGQVNKSRGKKEATEANTEAQREAETATRERARKAHEEITNGGDSHISEWLQRNDRFRD
jgi:hypothetical protein